MKNIKNNNPIIIRNNNKKWKQITEVAGNLEVHSSVKLDNLQKVSGCLIVTNKFTKLYAPKLKKIGGSLIINNSSKLNAPILQSVVDLIVEKHAKLNAPNLQTIYNQFLLYAPVELNALQNVGENLMVYSSAKLNAPKLKSIGKYLTIYGSAKLDALQSVEEVAVYTSAKLSAPKLKNIDKYLMLYGSAKLDALQNVGREISIHDYAKLDAPVLQSTGNLMVNNSTKLNAPNLQTIKGSLAIYGFTKLDALQSIDKYLIIDKSAKLDAPNLRSVGGYLAIYGKLNPEVEKLLWKKYKTSRGWFLSEKSSEFLLSRKGKHIEYDINNVRFHDKALFHKIRSGKISAAEVFSIQNMEQRRVAYEHMDKIRMKDLQNFKVVHEVADDGYGYPMRIISFKLDGYKKPFKFLNCFCPSSGREYFLETKQDTCEKAKAMSFGFSDIKFDAEW